MTTRLVLVTSNEDKVREAARFLAEVGASLDLERVRLELPEIQAATTAEVALVKARAAFAAVHRPVVIEDAGIELDALGGFPGPFIKYWELLGGLPSICRAVDGADRGVVAVCALAVCTGADAFAVEGRVRGAVAEAPRGTSGFGWDAIFVPDEGDGRTFGEMTAPEKDRISHRRRAWEALAARFP